MSSGPDPLPISDQEKYDDMMDGVDLIIESTSFNMANVTREPSDCDKLAAAIQALQTVYSQHCPIV